MPGGVAVIELGNGPRAPQARYQGKPTLVIREDGQRWIAIVGIPLSVKAGTQQLEVDGRSTGFQVGSRDYRAQHITLKNQRQVNPNPADLKRIERELDELIDKAAQGRAAELLALGPGSGASSSTATA